MRHLRVCSHFWAGPSPTQERKCMEIHVWDRSFLSIGQQERECFRALEIWKAVWNYGEEVTQERNEVRNLCVFPGLSLGSFYLSWLTQGCTCSKVVEFLQRLWPEASRACPGSPRENQTQRRKMCYHCSSINHMHHLRVYLPERLGVRSNGNKHLYKTSNFKAFNSFVLRLLLSLLLCTMK